jgi:hypothetical protein
MFNKKNLIYLFRLIVIASILLPSVSASATGNLKLENKFDNFPGSYATGEFAADVHITTIDYNLRGTGFTAEIPSCIDNILVSTLSNSSRMAFLTTTNQDGITPITKGQHIISSYENGKCTSNSTTIDILPNTFYIYQIPISDENSITQNRSSAISSRILDQIIPSKSLETVRTGGLSFNLFFLILPVLCYFEIRKVVLK